MIVPGWVSTTVAKVLGPTRADVARDMAWIERIPAAPAPQGRSSLFGTHIATNRAECPLSYLAKLPGPDTVRLDHGVMRGRTPDAVYTRDPVLARRVLQNKANPKTRAWYRFHHRMFAYKVPRDLLTYSNADDPMVGALRKAYTVGLAEAFERRRGEIVAHIERWTDGVALGQVEMSRASRHLVAELVHLVAFGELPRDRKWVTGYQSPEPMMLDPKRRFARLLWPWLDVAPTPYSLLHHTRAAAFRWMTAYYFNRYRTSTDSLLAWLRRQGDTDGNPDFAWQTLPFILNAANGILPYPLVMTLHLLAQRPADQDRVVSEGLYPAALKETMRLYPPVTTMARVVTEHVESESAVLEPMASPEGQVYMNPMALLRHARGWSRPDEFVLDRWLPGWQDDAEPDYRLYIPFGMGARSCVGAAFATKILETFLQVVLTRRVVSPFDDTPPRVAEGSVVLVRRPFRLQFVERI